MMKKTTIKDLTTSLDISRARVYQIINSLTGNDKVNKDKNGNFILDEKAVKAIRQYYTSTNVKPKQDNYTDRHVKSSESESTDARRKVDEQARLLEIKDEQIADLKKQVATLNAQAEKLTILVDQQQKLNLQTSRTNEMLLDFTKKLEEPKKTPEKEEQTEPVKDEPEQKKSFWSRFK